MRTFRIMSIIGVSALLLSASVAFAEDESTTNVVQRVEVSDVRAEVKQTAKDRAQAVREEAKKKMETTREEAKVRVEAVREKAKVRVEAQKEKATRRLADIQDKVKKQLAEKMVNQFERLNKTWTDHFLKLLDRYDEIVQKMRDRASVAASAGKDVTAADVAIQSAGTTIESARVAVVAQVAKTYTLDVSTFTAMTATSAATPSGQEEILKGLKTAFQELHRTLFNDLFALRDGSMKDARKAVQSALQALGKVPKVDDDEENTTATTTSNQ